MRRLVRQGDGGLTVSVTKGKYAVCRPLADDPDDMVYKALSWALLALAPHDPKGVRVPVEGAGDPAHTPLRVRREGRPRDRVPPP